LPRQSKFNIPPSRRMGHVDVIHGVEVPDPYRWLEDIDSEETSAWIEAQNGVTFGYLEKVPARQRIRERMTELWDFEKYGIPFKRGERYFYTYNDGLRNQPVLLWMEGPDGAPRELLDPNKLSEDGTVALTGYDVSEDGRLLAYGVSTAGSDWQEWRIRLVDTGMGLGDHLMWSKFTAAAWTHDNEGFYYSRFDEPKGEALKEANYYQKLYYHRVGDPQSVDELVYKRDDEKEWRLHGQVTEDGGYLVITVTRGTYPENQVFYKDLTGDGGVVELVKGFEYKGRFVANDGDIFYFLTDLDAPMGRVVAMDTRKPGEVKEVIPEKEDALETVSMVNDQFLAVHLHDAHSVVTVYSKTGEPLWEVEQPGMGTVTGFTGRKTDTTAFYHYASFTHPGSIYRVDLKERTNTIYKDPKLGFDPGYYVTEQVFYTSKDGTRVPMYITHKKGLEPKADNYCYLYGYGGFNINITPFFNVRNLVWMEMGGILCVANLRGAVRRHSPRRRRHGHAQVREVHGGLGLDQRLRLRREPRRVQGPPGLQPLPQPQAQQVPAHLSHYCRPRRQGLPGAQLQVRRRPPARPERRRTDSYEGRYQGGARHGEAHREGHRGVPRRAGVHSRRPRDGG